MSPPESAPEGGGVSAIWQQDILSVLWVTHSIAVFCAQNISVLLLKVSRVVAFIMYARRLHWSFCQMSYQSYKLSAQICSKHLYLHFTKFILLLWQGLLQTHMSVSTSLRSLQAACIVCRSPPPVVTSAPASNATSAPQNLSLFPIISFLIVLDF